MVVKFLLNDDTISNGKDYYKNIDVVRRMAVKIFGNIRQSFFNPDEFYFEKDIKDDSFINKIIKNGFIADVEDESFYFYKGKYSFIRGIKIIKGGL